jgi:hypothetical protein
MNDRTQKNERKGEMEREKHTSNMLIRALQLGLRFTPQKLSLFPVFPTSLPNQTHKCTDQVAIRLFPTATDTEGGRIRRSDAKSRGKRVEERGGGSGRGSNVGIGVGEKIK